MYDYCNDQMTSRPAPASASSLPSCGLTLPRPPCSQHLSPAPLFLWDPGRHFGLRAGTLKPLFSLSAIQITALLASTTVTILLPYLEVWGPRRPLWEALTERQVWR